MEDVSTGERKKLKIDRQQHIIALKQQLLNFP